MEKEKSQKDKKGNELTGTHYCLSVYLNVCLVLVTQSSLTICDPMDCSLPGSSVHGISQARILEWVS